MPSLENQVARQRDALMARGPLIRLRGARVRARLRHPVVLIPAFLGGVIIVRSAPVFLQTLPKLAGRVRDLTEELGRLETIIKVFIALAPPLVRPPGTAKDDSSGAQPPTPH